MQSIFWFFRRSFCKQGTSRMDYSKRRRAERRPSTLEKGIFELDRFYHLNNLFSDLDSGLRSPIAIGQTAQEGVSLARKWSPTGTKCGSCGTPKCSTLLLRTEERRNFLYPSTRSGLTRVWNAGAANSIQSALVAVVS